jgi:hypothetical protein
VTDAAGVSGTSPRADRGRRRLVVGLVVLSLGSVVALALRSRGSSGPLDALGARDRVLELDRRAEQAYFETELNQGGDTFGPAFGARMAAQLERTVLPLLREARQTALAIDPPDRHRRLVELLRSFTAAREAAFLAIVEALRTAGPEATVAAKTRQAEADRLRKEIDALGGP